MKTDEYINQFIERAKQLEPNPFLGTRIMGAIEKPVAQKSHPWYQIIAVASIGLAMFLGFQLSNIYNPTSGQTSQLYINDSRIEMLHYYQLETHD